MATKAVPVKKGGKQQVKGVQTTPRTKHNPKMTLHKQVGIQCVDRKAEVDEELAPIILALWRADIDTVLSCQEYEPGRAWIHFRSSWDVERFFTLVADRHEEVAVAAVVVEPDLGEHGEVAGDPRLVRRHLGEPDVRHVVANDAPHTRFLGRCIR